MKKYLFIFLSLIVIALALLPQILSTSFGKKWLEKAFAEKWQANVTIQSLHLSWLGPQIIEQLQFTRPDIEGSSEKIEAATPLWNLKGIGYPIAIQNMQLTFPKSHNMEIGPFNVTVANHHLTAEGKTGQEGLFHITGTIDSENDFDISFNGKELPSDAIDILLQANGLFAAIANPTTDLVIVCDYKDDAGSISIDFSAPHATATLDGTVAQEVLSLKKPLEASIDWTPELRKICHDMILSAMNPIILHVDAEGASAPLTHFSPAHLQVKSGTLNAGKLVVAELHPLISLLALLKATSINRSQATIWFTPAHFSIENGILRLQRIDALIENSVHLCAWGDIDLSTSQVNGNLGIPADTLASTLGLKNFPSNFVLTIPVQGRIDQLAYDAKGAAAKIATWIAGQQITNTLLKKAAPLQGILKQAPSLQQEPEAPPPNRPFPWESSYKDAS